LLVPSSASQDNGVETMNAVDEVFGRYAALYDGFYGDRGYGSEVDLIASRLATRSDDSDKPSVLDLGCGTGKHLELFARHGYVGCGVEQSGGMLAQARVRLERLPVRFVHADARRVRLAERFDLVVSLFHVLSYQEHDHDAIALLESAAAHASGPVVVDFWYGPGVLNQGLERREARCELGGASVTRVATPSHDAKRRLVDVRYDFTVVDASGRTESFSETHRMRYFFEDEVARFAARAGLEIAELGTWTRAGRPSSDDFAAYLIARTARG
jgi:SAM-dependent methyltransferase